MSAVIESLPNEILAMIFEYVIASIDNIVAPTQDLYILSKDDVQELVYASPSKGSILHYLLVSKKFESVCNQVLIKYSRSYPMIQNIARIDVPDHVVLYDPKKVLNILTIRTDLNHNVHQTFTDPCNPDNTMKLSYWSYLEADQFGLDVSIVIDCDSTNYPSDAYTTSIAIEIAKGFANISVNHGQQQHRVCEDCDACSVYSEFLDLSTPRGQDAMANVTRIMSKYIPGLQYPVNHQEEIITGRFAIDFDFENLFKKDAFTSEFNECAASLTSSIYGSIFDFSSHGQSMF